MAARKRAPGSIRRAPDIVRSSAVEYLTFVAASGEGGVEAVYADENVWLTQKMLAVLYDVTVPTVSYHLRRVFEDRELDQAAVVRDFLTTAADGKQYHTQHYNLATLITATVTGQLDVRTGRPKNVRGACEAGPFTNDGGHHG